MSDTIIEPPASRLTTEQLLDAFKSQGVSVAPETLLSWRELGVPTDPRALLNRRAGANALTKAGYATAHTTLATVASRGVGPPYRLYGHRVVYAWGALIAWAQSRLSEPRKSPVEGRVVAERIARDKDWQECRAARDKAARAGRPAAAPSMSSAERTGQRRERKPAIEPKSPGRPRTPQAKIRKPQMRDLSDRTPDSPRNLTP